MQMYLDKIVVIAITLIAVFLAIILHEVAHGYAAYVLGDDTAKRSGRLSLNPIKHIDPFGSIFLPLFLLWSGSGLLFGWAKPVPVNFYHLKKFPRDMLIVSGAGIAANLLLALVSGLLFTGMSFLPEMIKMFLIYFCLSNLVLAFFNLIPIPPLDGSKLFFGWIKKSWAQEYVSSERYGLGGLIIVIVVIPMIGASFGLPVIDPLKWYLSYAINGFLNLIGV